MIAKDLMSLTVKSLFVGDVFGHKDVIDQIHKGGKV
jgi:hypothetical protein